MKKGRLSLDDQIKIADKEWTKSKKIEEKHKVKLMNLLRLKQKEAQKRFELVAAVTQQGHIGEFGR